MEKNQTGSGSALTNYWIIVASRDHVRKGQEEEIAQACHGKKGPLNRMRQGDWVVFYSPKHEFEGQEKCQRFTAVAKVADELVYPFDMGGGFVPFRRKVKFRRIKETPIQPLIPDLEFIQNKKQWGYCFRFGLFKISEQDFKTIVTRMKPDPA